MEPGKIPGSTRNLGPPDGWDEERDGVCNHLPVLDSVVSGQHVISSEWELTAEERERLILGGKIHLHVWGGGMPPVALSVAEVVEGPLVVDLEAD